jgi:hypothetical protein
VVLRNRLARNVFTGISVLIGAENRILQNDVRDSTVVGIAFSGGTNNIAAHNAVRRTGDAGMAMAPPDPSLPPGRGNVFRTNVVRGAGTDGIAIATAPFGGSVVDALVERNIVIGSGDDGFDVQQPTTTLARNLALINGDLGIEAVPGVIDGGGNFAFGNGNPLQCLNVACPPRPRPLLGGHP